MPLFMRIAKLTERPGRILPQQGKVKRAGLRRQKPSALSDVMTLHRTLGNRAAGRMFESGEIQGKLTLGRPNDRFEREADRVADAVMHMGDPVQRQIEEEEEPLQAKPLAESITSPVRRQVEPEEEEEPVQAKGEVSAQEVPGSIEPGIRALHGGGQPLSREARAFFEPRFGSNFSRVRIHADARADRLAKTLHARAFTHQNQIVFRSGEYNPQSASGKRLLGHELTHVVQQGAAIRRQKEEKKKSSSEKAVEAAGKAAVMSFLKTDWGQKFKLKLTRFAKSPAGITLGGIAGTSVLSYMFAKEMDVPQGLIGLVPKFAKFDINKNVSLSFQPIFKGKFGHRPKEWGGVINLTITNF